MDLLESIVRGERPCRVARGQNAEADADADADADACIIVEE